MATKTEPPETKEPVVEEVPKTDLKDAIKEVMQELGIVKGEEPEAKVDEPTETKSAKPLSARDEESRMHEIATQAIKTFQLSTTDEKEPTEKVAESVPGKKPVRWIEKVMGWANE